MMSSLIGVLCSFVFSIITVIKGSKNFRIIGFILLIVNFLVIIGNIIIFIILKQG